MNENASSSPWLDGFSEPCDPAIFRRALDVWQAGADFALRKTPPTAPGLHLTDIPMNRSAMATIGFLRARGVSNTQAYLWRVMHFGELLEQALPGGPLEKYAKAGAENGALMVSEALLDAVALATIKPPNNPATENSIFDIDEIARIADEIWQLDGQNTEGE